MRYLIWIAVIVLGLVWWARRTANRKKYARAAPDLKRLH